MLMRDKRVDLGLCHADSSFDRKVTSSTIIIFKIEVFLRCKLETLISNAEKGTKSHKSNPPSPRYPEGWLLACGGHVMFALTCSLLPFCYDYLRRSRYIRVLEGRRDVNVALRRPAWQSSVYLNYGSLRADKSNDGNTATTFADYSCSSTGYELHPWWAVDLSSPLHVDGVNFTNRAEGTGGCRL